MATISGVNCNYIDGLPFVSDSAEEGRLNESPLSKQVADTKVTGRGNIRAILDTSTLPCLHTASVQWVGQVACMTMKLTNLQHSPSDICYLSSAQA